MLTAIRDFFPIGGARATFAEASREFNLIGAEDRIGFFEFDDPHGWSKPRREATAEWLERWLHNRRVDGAEPEFPIIPPAELNCTPTGQVANSLGGETIHSMNRTLAEGMYSHRTALRASSPELRRLVAERLHLPVTRGTPPATNAGSVNRNGYRIDKIVLETEPGISIPALLFIPGNARGRLKAILLLDPRGKDKAGVMGGEAEKLVHEGNAVLVPDLRQWGESAPTKGKSGYSGDWQTAMRALLLGKNLPGMQVYDALRAFDYLVSQASVDQNQVSIQGAGDGALIAIFTAVLEARVHLSPANAPVPSYMDEIKMNAPNGLVSRMIPGVLADFDIPDLTVSLRSFGRSRFRPERVVNSDLAPARPNSLAKKSTWRMRSGCFNASVAFATP